MSEPGPPGPMVATDPEAVTHALLQAVLNAANHANVATDARDMQSSADAALKFAQAIAILDPTIDPQGVPLSHHTALEEMRGQSALEQARLKASAPTPSKSVSVKRDGNGRATAYSVSG
jgi:hypothetical protein